MFTFLLLVYQAERMQLAICTNHIKVDEDDMHSYRIFALCISGLAQGYYSQLHFLV